MKDFKFLFEKIVLGQHFGWRDQRHYEEEVQRAARKIRGKLFVDIGAFKGFYLDRLSKNFDWIIAFEPNRNINPQYRSSNVQLSRFALSDHEGSETFYCHDNGGADGLQKDFDYEVPDRGYAPEKHGEWGPVIDSFPVKVFTYDQMIKEIADLVMIDTEGEEFKVLAGMVRLPPKNIIVEMHNITRENLLIEKMREREYQEEKLDVVHYIFRKR